MSLWKVQQIRVSSGRIPKLTGGCKQRAKYGILSLFFDNEPSRGSGLKTHNYNAEIFKALVQVSVDSCDGAMKELFPLCGFSSHKEGRHRSMAGEGLKRKTPLRSSLHPVSKGQEEQGKRSRWPAEFTAGRNCS